MLGTEIMTGEIASRKAKRVLYPIIGIYLANFVLMAVRWQMIGYSGVTAGRREDGGYAVVEHGQAVFVSAGEYWFSRIQVFILIAGLFVWFIARARLLRSGDLRSAAKYVSPGSRT